jgi:hypothetical protein
MSEVGPVQRFFGGALMAVGFLIMALCGICSTCGVIMGLTDPTFRGGDTLALVLVVGGVPFALGLGLFVAGKAVRRTPPEAILPPTFGGDDTP